MPAYIYFYPNWRAFPYHRKIFRTAFAGIHLLYLSWPVFPYHRKSGLSKLPKLSLILEKILFLFIYPKIKDRLKPRQHGFRAKHSTVTQLLIFLHEFYLNFDGNVEQVVVYLDFSNAFDTVDHSTLLSKIIHFGFDEDFVKPINSYLPSRSRCVKLDCFLSASLPVTSGVPQGSVLGPLFFLIFIDDMIDVPEVSKVFCYADDTKLLCNGDFYLYSAQIDLCLLRLLAYCDYFSFNLAKSGYVHNSRLFLDKILLGDVEIPSLDNITDLGVEVSKTLKWSLHIQTKIVKACRSFNYLKHSVPFNLPFGVKFNLRHVFCRFFHMDILIGFLKFGIYGN